LGIVDEDFEDREYAEEFTLLFHLSGQLKLKKHPASHHYLIMICPGFEEWLLERTKEMGKTMEDYGLHSDLIRLRKTTKTAKSEDEDPYSDNFRRLFKSLRDHNSVCIALIRFWITYLKENPYTADLTYLVEETHRLTQR
jgi:hypothetical protein